MSPNWYDIAAEQISDVRDAPSSKRTGVLQTLACPWCGTKLLAQRDLRPDDDRRRILLYCPSGEGPDPCPFSSDPLCAERLPKAPADFLHGAACHACLFVSETTCERGNRFLDRRFIVPIDDQFPCLIPS